MALTPGFFDFVQKQGDLLAAKVVSRDNVHLSPTHLNKAAAARFRAGLRALEAYLRRLILCLALALEPGLKANNYDRNPRERVPNLARKPRFKILAGDHDCPDLAELLHDPWADPRPWVPPGQPVRAAPLIEKLCALKALLDAPLSRAKRLAFHLARYRPGWLLAPGQGREVPRRWGTELSAVYESMAQMILEASKARPPPLGPIPKRPPRIRSL